MPDGRVFRAPSLPVSVDGEVLSGGGDVPEAGADTERVLGALGLDPASIAAARGTTKERAA